MEELKCNYCSKSFVSKSNLNTHKRKAKYCLEIQRKLNVDIVVELESCEYCGLDCDPKNMKRHLLSCRTRNLQVSNNYEEQIRSLKAKTKKYKEQIHSLSLMYEEKLKKMEIDLNIANAKLEILKDDHASLVGLAKQPKTTNNTVNKVMNMSVLNLEHDRLQNIIQTDLTYNHGAGGQKGIAEFVDEKVLIDDEGKGTLLCTDPARRVFKYLDSEGKVCKDIEARSLTDSLVKASLVDQAVKVCKAWCLNPDGSVDFERTRYMEEKIAEIRKLQYDNTVFARELSVLTA